MLNRSQLYTLLLLRKHNGNLFSSMPRDVISIIGSYSKTRRVSSMLLHYIAYGDLGLAKFMLKVNPRLVLQAGNERKDVKTRVKSPLIDQIYA